MAIGEQTKRLYEFGPFRIDVAEHSLLRDGAVVTLTPKAFDTLVLLVENSGHLLEKEELMQRLWPDTFVEEANLSNNISLLRKVLGNDPEGHHYIETVPKHGYRFAAKVVEGTEDSAAFLVAQQTIASRPLEEANGHEQPPATVRQPGKRRTGYVLPLIAVVGLLAIVFAAVYFRLKHDVAPAPIKSIAVLPFRPLVAEDRDELLELGMTETLITRLSGLKDVRVRSMSAVRKYDALDRDPLIAGKEQKVEAVLEGNVQKTGDRVRVTVRLLRVQDGQTLWADTFDTPLADILALQDSLSERVATVMAVKLTGEEKQLLTRRPTDNREAYELYLKGRLFHRQWTAEGLQKALLCYSQAIAIDPNYALAYAGKADVYSGNASVFLPPSEAMPKAREAARKALELDDRLPEAHRSMAFVKQFGDWDWAGAEHSFRRALELKPNDAEIHANYSGLLMSQRRFDEAMAELRQAQELDPFSLAVKYRTGLLFYFSRQYERALQHSRDVAALYPNSDEPHRSLGSVLSQKGIYKEAIAELEKAVELRRADGTISALGNTYALAGQRDQANTLVKELEEHARRRYVSPVSIARIYAGLGDRERVFKWLDKGYKDRSDHLLALGIDPTFDSVRSDPRFAVLMRRVGLAP